MKENGENKPSTPLKKSMKLISGTIEEIENLMQQQRSSQLGSNVRGKKNSIEPITVATP